MSSKESEILESCGKKFVRTGERRYPAKGEWFIDYAGVPLKEIIDHASYQREILRELPAAVDSNTRPCVKAGCPNDAEPNEMACAEHQHTVYDSDSPSSAAVPGEAIRELADKLFADNQSCQKEWALKVIAEALAQLLEKARCYFELELILQAHEGLVALDFSRNKKQAFEDLAAELTRWQGERKA